MIFDVAFRNAHLSRHPMPYGHHERLCGADLSSSLYRSPYSDCQLSICGEFSVCIECFRDCLGVVRRIMASSLSQCVWLPSWRVWTVCAESVTPLGQTPLGHTDDHCQAFFFYQYRRPHLLLLSQSSADCAFGGLRGGGLSVSGGLKVAWKSWPLCLSSSHRHHCHFGGGEGVCLRGRGGAGGCSTADIVPSSLV